MNEVTFLFYGFGSEYILHPLYIEMSKRGNNCVEIDAFITKNSKILIDTLVGKTVVFITSAHLLLDKKNFTDFYPNTNTFYSVLEIISRLRPLRSIYIPHDLTQPLIRNERQFINQFDVFLTPCEPFTSAYEQYCNVIEVGWIKYRKQQSKSKKSAIWFLSDYVLYVKMGPEKSYRVLASIVQQGVAIKFPAWTDSNRFEQFFKKQGVHVYSSLENTVDLIQDHSIILTNGLSSIIAESYFLGKTTVNIVEGSHYGTDKEYLLDMFPQLIMIEKREDFQLSHIKIQKRESVLKPFDMERVIEVITTV